MNKKGDLKICKTSNEDDSRALLLKDFKRFTVDDKKMTLSKKDDLSPFVKFVKAHDELELCFRGNSKDNPRISIYYNNHIVFSVSRTGLITISFNHARYSEKWDEYYKCLVTNWGFRASNKIVMDGDQIQLSYPIDVGYMTRSVYHFQNEMMTYKEDYEKNHSFTNLEKLYQDILRHITEDYFNASNASSDKKKDVKDFFKCKKGKPASPSRKEEKVQQQKLFHKFKKNDTGYDLNYFFYDMEFAQRHKNKTESDEEKNKNEPDMLAIRFDQSGIIPKRIAFVEVKSTKEAMYGEDSGLIAHIEKMANYFDGNSDREAARRKEACDIFNQYAWLGLRGLNKNDVLGFRRFEPLEFEILLIFTGKARDEWKSDFWKYARDTLDEKMQMETVFDGIIDETETELVRMNMDVLKDEEIKKMISDLKDTYEKKTEIAHDSNHRS